MAEERSPGRAERRWWERGIIYQVYPRSFMDSDGDGVGDLPGILARLDYLRELGVDAIWLSPIYPSPMADFGYDVSDYTAIDPVFGTMADFDALVSAVHRAGMRLLLDFVPNHTSIEHPWFRASRRSRVDPRRDWYIWRDPGPGGGPPNNWHSTFGGSAWELDPATGQYYYHAFLREQPDLNWRNPAVRAAMYDVLRFWLDRGVDGFRVDVIWHLVKDLEFRDDPRDPDWQEGQALSRRLRAVHSADRPEVHEVIAEMRAVLDRYDDRMLVGEIYLPVDRLVVYYGAADRRGVHLPFNFQLIELPWDARVVREAMARYEAALPAHGWPNWVLGNHDKPRIASRVGPRQARVAAMLLLTLRGTPTLYYGDEIGMRDVPIPPGRARDPSTRGELGRGPGRDPQRTPMQWDAGPNAGFTTGTPWLPLADDWRTVNVAAQRADPCSLLRLYQRLIALRRAEPALSVGSWRPLPSDGSVIAYLREEGAARLLVALDLGGAPAHAALPDGRWEIVLATGLDRAGERAAGAVELRGDEGLVLRPVPPV